MGHTFHWSRFHSWHRQLVHPLLQHTENAASLRTHIQIPHVNMVIGFCHLKRDPQKCIKLRQRKMMNYSYLNGFICRENNDTAIPYKFLESQILTQPQLDSSFIHLSCQGSRNHASDATKVSTYINVPEGNKRPWFSAPKTSMVSWFFPYNPFFDQRFKMIQHHTISGMDQHWLPQNCFDIGWCQGSPSQETMPQWSPVSLVQWAQCQTHRVCRAL